MPSFPVEATAFESMALEPLQVESFQEPLTPPVTNEDLALEADLLIDSLSAPTTPTQPGTTAAAVAVADTAFQAYEAALPLGLDLPELAPLRFEVEDVLGQRTAPLELAAVPPPPADPSGEMIAAALKRLLVQVRHQRLVTN